MLLIDRNIFFLILLSFQIIHSENILKTKENKECENKKDMMRHYYCYNDTEDESLLDMELIDVVIKYIDLSDEKLIRKGIKQLNKDIENGEIKYCIRSILTNIPWVNKIYIIMPNDKVKYFKSNEEIKEKIIYIKDKELIGFDSASSTVFEFNLWRLKNFGVTQNFIYFNDDYFVGKPLKKSDFFYQYNGKVVSYAIGINDNISRIDIEKYHQNIYNEIIKQKEMKQDNIEYFFQINSTRLFIYKLFGDSAKIIKNNHNALGDNLLESEEIYNIILNKYHSPNDCLRSIYRGINQMIYQEFRINYIINKYNRTIKQLNTRYYDIEDKPEKVDLFVINKGWEEYKYFILGRNLIFINNLFPIPSKYEKREIPNGFYILETKLKSNMILNVDYDYNRKVNTLYLKKRKDKYSEVFYIEYQNDSYIIKSLITDSFLEVSEEIEEKRFLLSFNENIEGDKQRWYFLSNNQDYYFIVSKNNSKCGIDVTDNRVKNNVRMQCYYPNGKYNQLFKFISIKQSNGGKFLEFNFIIFFYILIF